MWGNAKLVSWDFGKDITVTLEDALMSFESLRVMLGGAIKHPSESEPVVVRHTEEVVCSVDGKIPAPRDHITSVTLEPEATPEHPIRFINLTTGVRTQVASGSLIASEGGNLEFKNDAAGIGELVPVKKGDHVRMFWDSVITSDDGQETAVEITISPNTFPSTYEIQGETFIRSAATGKDEPFIWTILKGKVSSEVTITLESEGDPTTFELTITALRATNERGEPEMMRLQKYHVNGDAENGSGDDIGSLEAGKPIVGAKAQVMDQGSSYLSKSISDLVDTDISIGDDGSVTGTLKYVDVWNEFETGAAGYFFPVKLSSDYRDKVIRVTSSRVKEAIDLDWILKVKDKDATFKFEADEQELFTLNFANATFDIPIKNVVQVIDQEHDLGKFGKQVKELVGPDLTIDDEGAITGTFKYISGWTEFSAADGGAKGYFLPLRLQGEYAEKEMTVRGKHDNTNTSQDWIMQVDGPESTFTILDGETELAKLTMTEATFELPKGANAISVPTDGEFAGQQLATICKDLAVAWDGATGAVTGTLYKNGEQYQVPIQLNEKFAEKTVDVGGSTEAKLQWLVPVTDTATEIEIKCEEEEIGKLTFTGITLADSSDV